MPEELYCPRCIQRPISEEVSLTDNSTRICKECAQSERAYQKAKARGVSDFTLNLWGFEKKKWPVNASVHSSWKNINFKAK